MKPRIPLVQALCLLLFWQVSSPPPGTAAQNRHVLVLQSYHASLPWSRALMKGIEKGFREGGLSVEIHEDYLDNLRFPGEALFEVEEALLRRKFQRTSLELLIPTDDPALSFLLSRRDSLFSGIPIVFCGPNSLDGYRIDAHKRITGVVEQPDYRGTMELALSLHPRVREVAIVSDRHPVSLKRLEEIGKLGPTLGKEISVRVLTDESLDALKAEVAALPDTSLVFFHTFLRDRQGNHYRDNAHVLETLAGVSRVPIYSYKEVDVGPGATGGMVLSPERMGLLAARMGIRVLKGEAPETIPIEVRPSVYPLFDARKLDVFGVGESSLPPGSVVLHKSFSFYQTYRVHVLAILVILLGLLLLVGFLARSTVRRKRAEKALQQAYGTLDLKVQERTRDLSTLNEKLATEIEERRAAERTLRAMFDAISETALLLDTQGRILIANDIAAKRLGRPLEDLTGQDVFTLFDPESRESRREVMEGVLRTGEAAHQRDARNGRVYDSHWYPVRDPEGQPKAVVVFALDITERRMAEEERVRVEKLESIGILAGGIAHDFNNLLTGIIGFLDLAKLEGGDPSEKAQKYLGEAQKLALRCKDLTRRFSAFSGGGGPVKRTLRLEGLLKGSAQLALSGSNCEVEFRVETGLWPVACEEAQIRDVVTTLVTNAREAMEGGGKVTILAENLPGRLPGTDGLHEGWVHIAVEDLGCGIPEAHMGRLFDPYFSTKQRGTQKGMGLSLATAFAIIKTHGGHIRIASREGVGTTVHLYLPAERPGPAETGPKTEPPFPAEERRDLRKVLVMDDEPVILDVVVEMLGLHGYLAVPSREGREAVALYRRAMEDGQPFDLVILDLTVKGGMGGREAMKELMACDPKVLAIVSSGYSEDTVMSHYRDYGFAAAVAKPYEMRRLLSTIEKISR